MSRFSLAKKGIEVKGETIDADFTENIRVLLYNNSTTSYTIQPQERIAQAVFLQLAPIERLIPVPTREELGKTDRGTDGLGSSGQFDMKSFYYHQEQEDDDIIKQ